MKIGDIVNLKHGGACMTIIATDGNMHTTMWTDNQNVPHIADIPEDSLELTEFDEDK